MLIPGEKVVNITYNPNGGVIRGSEETLVIQYNEGDIVTIPEAPEREGYKFLYWKGSEHQPGDKYVVGVDHEFIAQWEKINEEEPVAPAAPEEPKSPEKPVTPSSEGVKTGDASTPTFWAIILVLCGILVILMVDMGRCNLRRTNSRRKF